MTVHLIVAMDEGRLIGRDNDLPWHLPADLKRFRRLTMGHPLVMGRRTWESIGRPLPGRTSIVVTRRTDYAVPEGVHVAASPEGAFRLASGLDDDVFVIGGAALYAETLPRADRLHVTLVHARLAGDARFPAIDDREWRLVEERSRPADARNAYDLTFRTYERARARRGASGKRGHGAAR
jgi:dihydrofolate reductase